MLALHFQTLFGVVTPLPLGEDLAQYLGTGIPAVRAGFKPALCTLYLLPCIRWRYGC